MIEMPAGINQRAKDSPWSANFKDINIALIGAGGIGSNTILSLAKNDPYAIYAIDSDIIEEHNIGNQLFNVNSLGKYKVEAVKQNTLNFCNYPNVFISATNIEDVTRKLHQSQIIISAIDNMKGRKFIFDQLNQRYIRTGRAPFYVDARQSATEIIIYAFKFDEDKKREKYQEEALFSDEEAADLPCGFKSTMHTGQMTGSLITSLVCNHMAGPDAGLAVPFKLHFNMFLMDFLTNE